MGNNRNSRKIIIVFCVLFFATITGYVKASELGTILNKPITLSMNSAVLFALNKNPDIEMFWERYIQSKNFVKESQAGFFPTVDLNISGGREYRDPSAGTSPLKNDVTNNVSFGITVEQMIYDGFKTVNETNRRRDLNEAALWRVQSNVENILQDTIENYLEMVLFQAEIKAISLLIMDIKETLMYVESQFTEGAASKVIVDYANSRLSFAETSLSRAQSSYNDAKSRLEFLTGRLPPIVEAYYPEEMNPEKLDMSFYLDSLDDGNSLMLANQYEIEAMKKQLKIQKAANSPEASLVLHGSQSHNDGGNIGVFRELSASMRVSYNIFDGFKNKYAKRRVFSQISELEHRKDKVKNELVRDIKLFYNQIIANKQSLLTNESEIRSSEALKVLNEENFKSGNLNIIELIESAERLNVAKLSKIRLINDQYLNAYKLIIKANVLDQNFFCESC